VITLAIVLAVAVGIALGLLGGGGSILAVPLLVYVAGLGTKEAIATSLLVVGVTSAVGIVPHALARRVRWRTGLLFGAAAMAGAYAGGRLAVFVPGPVLLVAFALMMLATAVAMIRSPRGKAVAAAPAHGHLPIGPVLLEGSAVGLVTGLVGAGGGFLVVPALVLLGGLPMASAVGTSLVVITMKSFAALMGYLAVVEIDWMLAARIGGAAMAGTLIGARLAARCAPDTLRRAFGWFVVAMGAFVLAQQLPPLATLLGLTLAAGYAVGWLTRGHQPAATPAAQAAPKAAASGTADRRSSMGLRRRALAANH
jgi:uncharacterized membrane protein YfcA